MKSIVHAQFEKEILVSERLRATVLAGFFLVSSLFAITFYSIYNSSQPGELKRESLVYVFVFMLMLCAFELFCRFYLTRLIKKNSSGIPLFKQYINATVEISSPLIVLILTAKQYEVPVKVLHSPIAYIYFIFIILSTLRLNTFLSLYLGLLAATEFFLLSLYLGKQTDAGNISSAFLITSIGKSMAILFCGVGASFVARQIRRTITRSLTAAEKEHRIVHLFGQQISKEIVDEMLLRDGAIQSKLMQVCVMFVDIRNFTGHVATKSPEEIVAYQNTFFSLVVNAVSRHRGIVNQFLGDGCMITFGAPVALDNPCKYAIAAALEIKQQLEIESLAGKMPPTQIGVGIHVGDAVTGNIGTSERQQYSITGSVVVLAARIEQLNKQYQSQILISENVMEGLPGGLVENPQFIGKADLKGWNMPVGIYKVA